jgi:hypothetical protein
MAIAIACLLHGGLAHAGPAGTDGEDFIYVVDAGDTLFQLADRFMARPDGWRELQALNRVANPYRLAPGTRIRIPLRLIPVTTGTVRVVSAVGEVVADGKPVRAGMQLAEAERISTGADGLVTLELTDGSRVALPQNTSLDVRRVRVFARSGLGDTVLHVDRGSAESQVAPGRDGVGRFEMRTPMMVTGVRGTRYEVSAGEREARGVVLEGAVSVRGRGRAAREVRAGYGVNVGGNGAVSAPRALLPAPTLPELPAPIYAPSAEVSWEPVRGAASYLVTVTRDRARTEAVSSQTVQAPRATLAGLPHGKLYLHVRAVDASRLAGYPGTAAMTVRLEPAAPFTLEPARGATHYGESAVMFGWARVDAAEQYLLEIADNPDFSGEVRRMTTRDTGAAQVLGNGQWWWRVRSLDAAGEPGPWSAAMPFSVLPQAPSASVADDGSGTLHLGWPADASGQRPAGYRVQLAADAAFSRLVADVSATGNEVNVPRPPSGEYFVRVARVERDGGVSPFSSPQRIELHEFVRDANGVPVTAGESLMRRGG